MGNYLCLNQYGVGSFTSFQIDKIPFIVNILLLKCYKAIPIFFLETKTVNRQKLKLKKRTCKYTCTMYMWI